MPLAPNNKKHKKTHEQNYLKALVSSYKDCKIKAESLLILLGSRGIQAKLLQHLKFTIIVLGFYFDFKVTGNPLVFHILKNQTKQVALDSIYTVPSSLAGSINSCEEEQLRVQTVNTNLNYLDRISILPEAGMY